MKRFALLCISLVSLLMITSCGGPKSEAEQVTKNFYKALFQKNFDEARSYTASPQAELYVNFFSLALSAVDLTELSSANLDRGIRIVTTEQSDDDTIECFVKIAKDKDGKEFGESTQRVLLKKIDGEWKIVSIPMNK